MNEPRRTHPAYGPALAPVRLGTEQDLPFCLAIDDGYTTNRLWQMDLHRPDDTLAPGATDLDDALGMILRPVRLPRPLPIPGEAATLAPAERLARWHDAEALLVVGPRPPSAPAEPEPPLEGPMPDSPRPLPPAEVWGYALLAAERAAGRAWIQLLVVGPAHRGQGLGGRLLDAAKAWARAGAAEGGAGGLTALLVALSPKNYPAIAFCRHRGFRFCGYNDYTLVGGDVHLYFICPLRG
jgi:GNAT superfamily N-acetyltransferase